MVQLLFEKAVTQRQDEIKQVQFQMNSSYSYFKYHFSSV